MTLRGEGSAIVATARAAQDRGVGSWRTVACLGAACPVLAAVITVVINGSTAVPFSLTVGVLFGALGLGTLLGRRAAPWALSVVAVGYVAFLSAFGLPAYLVRPTSFATFVDSALNLLGVLAILGSILVLRRLRRARPVAAWVVAGLAVLVVVTGGVAGAMATDVPPEPGDVRVLMVPDGSSFDCRVPDTVGSGVQHLYVANRDTVPHRFMWGAADVEVRAGGSVRMAVTLQPGRVAWRCVYFGHQDRTGSARATA